MTDRLSRVGQQMGDYHLLRRLGGGGFGEVYLGEHVRTQAQAAVKVLQTRLTRSDELKEFINEARTFRLHHPHIVQLLDFGIDTNDIPYLVMEYASHGTLRDAHPKGTQVPLSLIRSYVVPLASALQYAHDQQLIHRDVKPENMLLGARHEVLLSDFGIAAVAHSSRSLSTQEGIGGTLPYMAPEQLQGKPRPASDQYALGIVVYEWLTGTRPFKGTAVEVAMQHHLTPPPPLREQVPLLSADVEQVVLTALAKEPKQRFASIMAFSTALEQASRERDVFPPVALPLPDLHASPLPDAATPRLAAEVKASLDSEPISAKVLLPTVSSSLVSSLHRREMTEPVFASFRSQPASLLKNSPPVPFPYKKRRRRLLALFLIGLAILAISGSIGLSTMTTQISTRNVQITAKMRALSTGAAVAYNTAVALHGSMFGFDAQHTRANPFEQILSPATVSGLKTAWSSDPTYSIYSSPAVVNGVVYVGSGHDQINAYNAQGCGSGKSPCAPLWSSDPTSTGGFIPSSPAVVNGVVYVGSEDGKLYAYNAQGCGSRKSPCAPVWSSEPTGGSIRSSPAVVNGVVYVGSDDDKLYAYNAQGCGIGKSLCPPVWSSEPTGGVISTSPAVVNGVVYVGSADGRLYAFHL